MKDSRRGRRSNVGKLNIKTKQEIEEEKILEMFMPTEEEIEEAELQVKILEILEEVI